MTTEPVICSRCNRDMGDAETITCAGDMIDFPNGKMEERIPFMPMNPDARCGDCDVAIDGLHHWFCQHEVCPLCQGQLISCGCMDEPGAGGERVSP